MTPRRLEPGGETATPAYLDKSLPAVHTPEDPKQRFRDLPAAEQLRRKVEETVRFYANRHGRILSAEALCNYKKWPLTRVPDVQAAMTDPVTVANLTGLGILHPDVETWDQAVAGNVQPTTLQMNALDAIFTRLDPTDPRPLPELLKEQGVDLRTWNGWLADPVFGAYVRDRSAAVFGQRAHEVDIALMRRAFAGDTKAIQLILELQGRIKTGDRDTLDVNMVLARVVEIIQLEVSDPDTQLRIASRLEALAQASAAGKLPPSRPVLAAELTGDPL